MSPQAATGHHRPPQAEGRPPQAEGRPPQAEGRPPQAEGRPPQAEGRPTGPGPHYTLYHPRWYRRRVSVWWWLQNRAYARFVLRELTSVFVAFFAVVLLWQVRALGQGPEAYARFVARLETPLFLVLHGLAFIFVLFHAVTWFNLAPSAMVVRVSGRRVPDWVIVGLNYGAWLVLSIAVAVVLFRG